VTENEDHGEKQKEETVAARQAEARCQAIGFG